jgi:5-formyltetrahydrofolate cyclo-ligase
VCGGGFYDRLLAQPEWANKPTIGIVFEFAYLDPLDSEPWDCLTRSIFTEKGFIAIDYEVIELTYILA